SNRTDRMRVADAQLDAAHPVKGLLVRVVRPAFEQSAPPELRAERVVDGEAPPRQILVLKLRSEIVDEGVTMEVGMGVPDALAADLLHRAVGQVVEPPDDRLSLGGVAEDRRAARDRETAALHRLTGAQLQELTMPSAGLRTDVRRRQLGVESIA